VGQALPGLPRRPDRDRRAVAEAVRATPPDVSISICWLEELVSRGPFAPIFRDVGEPTVAVDWLGGAG